MRLSRLVMLSLGTVAMIACGSDNVTNPKLPPLSSVRFINALSDTGAVDIRAVDQIEFSPVANNLAYRDGTVYQNTEAGVRHFRVFPTSTDISVTSQVLADASVTLPENTRITLLLTGSARAGQVFLWVIDDGTVAPPAGQIGVRMVNAATGQVNGYIVSDPSDPLPGSPTYTGVFPHTPSVYVNLPAAAAALQVTDVGSNSVNASEAGPAAPATLPGQFPAAGVTSTGSMLSAYYFPTSVTGSAAPQTAAFQIPGIVWFVDRNPCDAPAVAGCTL